MQFYEEKRTLSKKLKKIEEKRVETIEKQSKKLASKNLDDDEKTLIEHKKQKNLEKMFKYS
jgi:hypothetical protein